MRRELKRWVTGYSISVAACMKLLRVVIVPTPRTIQLRREDCKGHGSHEGRQTDKLRLDTLPRYFIEGTVAPPTELSQEIPGSMGRPGTP